MKRVFLPSYQVVDFKWVIKDGQEKKNKQLVKDVWVAEAYTSQNDLNLFKRLEI